MKKNRKGSNNVKRKDHSSDDSDSDSDSNFSDFDDEIDYYVDDFGNEVEIKTYCSDKDYLKKLEFEHRDLKEKFRNFIAEYNISHNLIKKTSVQY